MKTRGEKIIGAREDDDVTMNFVSRQAQEAILNPCLPEPYKDEVVRAAVGTLLRIADNRNAYSAKRAEKRRASGPRVICRAKNGKDEEWKKIPPIIKRLNENQKTKVSEGMENFTVEIIAEKVGISRNILYEWVRTHSELLESFEDLKFFQKEDPFKSETAEDAQVAALMITLFLMDARNRHYKPQKHMGSS